MPVPPSIDDVLAFWFADSARWWKKDPAFDAEVRERFAARMFESDPRARAAARIGVDRDLGALSADERRFLCMPFMHSEDLEDQDRSVALFASASPDDLRYAEQHREIIRRFGRFPHRNALLGRPSTAEEAAFLEQPGSSF